MADAKITLNLNPREFDIIREVMDQLMLVDESQIAQAVLYLLEYEKMVIEGGGAVPLAAAMNPALNLAGKKVVLILSGGNIDVSVIGKIIDRGLAAKGFGFGGVPRERAYRDALIDLAVPAMGYPPVVRLPFFDGS